MAEEMDIRAVLEELAEERRRREGLEKRVEEAERGSAIRAELQKLGVAKLELAYKAVKDDVPRENGEMKAYLEKFVGENPELLPARVAGGSGASAGSRGSGAGAGGGGYRQDPAWDECGRDGQGKAGNRAGGVANATRALRKRENTWEQLHRVT